MTDFAPSVSGSVFPQWVPTAAQHYIFHTEAGYSIRSLAKGAGCHASTVMRQVRKVEARRDDPLIDAALTSLAAHGATPAFHHDSNTKDGQFMTKQMSITAATPDDKTVEREARRILRRLGEPQACLAVAQDMEKAVVVREAEDGRTTRTAVVDRPIAQAMALKDWINCDKPGRISRYRITSSGRDALKRLLAQDDAARTGFAESPARFGDQSNRVAPDPQLSGVGQARKLRYIYAESPVASMARRKDKGGKPFLSSELVSAAERLREDFEVAQMGPRVAQNWDRYLSGGDLGDNDAVRGTGDGQAKARLRVSEALRTLGPGLGDVVLRVCCYLEGLEAAEKRMGWSARSGKIVLRIALQRLKQHYEAAGSGAMIG